ncbi:MAG: hypothetical protein A3C55_02360 [Gammaproteobacteria bacterium RIFCSPHIGHO2_02_FULL_42_13]|nr:MAG: hypothetical protein A3C55_02360 [Gammaproteobacteria bacterium RIFCSPHIGHO2_02_FULL_42_13]OGT68482.1 MAG: hypothetical protein A3H43_03665 [Gammaproteobacteria bacterium RIFCSPLOWO2_02_FULL_42_9]
MPTVLEAALIKAIKESSAKNVQDALQHFQSDKIELNAITDEEGKDLLYLAATSQIDALPKTQLLLLLGLNTAVNLAFLGAVRMGRVDIMAVLYEASKDKALIIRQASPKLGWTPVFMSVFYEQRAALQWLIEHGAAEDLTTPNNDGQTPLMVAVRNPALLEEFFHDIWQTEIHRKDKLGRTAIHHSALVGSVAGMEWLAQRGGVELLLVPAQTGATPFQIAATQGHVTVLAWICEKIGKTELTRQEKEAQTTPFAAAARKGQLNVLDWFMTYPEGAAEMHRPDAEGRLPIHYVVRAGCLSSFNWLVERGVSADMHSVDTEGRTLFYDAALAEESDELFFILEKLFNVCPEYIDRPNRQGKTPLWVAGLKGHAKTVDWLLNRIEKIDHDGRFGIVALLTQVILTEGGSEAVFERLLQVPGFNINGNSGKVPSITAACMHKRHKMIHRLLLMPGIDVNRSFAEHEFLRPIAYAISNNDLEGVKMLVEAGCDLWLSSGISAYHIAYPEHLEIAEYLLEADRDRQNRAVRKDAPNVLNEVVAELKIDRHDPVFMQVLLERANQPISSGDRQAELLKIQNLEMIRILESEKVQRGLPSGITQTLEREYPGILQEYRLRLAKEAAETYLVGEARLKAFYFHLQSKLTEFFLAYKVLSSGLVTRERETTETMAEKGISLLGAIIPIPGVSVIANAISAGVARGLDRRIMKKYQFFSELLRNLSVLDKAVQDGARELTFKYEDQILQLATAEDTNKLSEGVVARFIMLLDQEYFDASRPVSEQLSLAISNPDFYQQPIWRRGVFLHTIHGQKWLLDDIFEKTGVQLSTGERYKRQNGEPGVYGYRLGFLTEIQRPGFIVESRIKDRHPLAENPFRFSCSASLDSHPVTGSSGAGAGGAFPRGVTHSGLYGSHARNLSRQPGSERETLLSQDSTERGGDCCVVL